MSNYLKKYNDSESNIHGINRNKAKYNAVKPMVSIKRYAPFLLINAGSVIDKEFSELDLFKLKYARELCK